MANEILKESNPKKIKAWDRIHDKRKLYRCERCGAEWKCEYGENKFGSKHEINGDSDILCQCCGFPTAKEVMLREIPDILDDEEEDYLLFIVISTRKIKEM